MPFSADTVVIAVSGGADSVSLLLAMHELRQRGKLDLRLVAAHFNHGLRDGDSNADEEFIQKLTIDHGIELAVARGVVSRDGNLEQNARLARYEFLKKTAINVNASSVLTGHTVNDQAETFLMNLIRGSGVEGLSGMRSVRDFVFGDSGAESENLQPGIRNSNLALVRPLLTWAKRADTEAYCHSLGVEYRYDTMNEDTAFKRVRIRKILLPLLEDLNPNIIATIANTAGLMQNLQDDRDAGIHSFVDDELILADVKELSKPRLYETIRSWLRQHRGTMRQLQLKHIEAIERLILSDRRRRGPGIPGGIIVKWAGKLRYKENKVEN